MLQVIIDKETNDWLDLELGNFKGNQEKAKRLIETFATEHSIVYESLGAGYATLSIDKVKVGSITPYGIDIEMMLGYCGIDPTTLKPMTKRNSPINPPGILNFSSITVPLTDPIGYSGSIESSPHPYVAEKPGGTDIGHLIEYEGQRFIVKMGISLSLLAQALENTVGGDKEKAEKKLGIFIIGNYTRIAGIIDEALIAQLKATILAAFKAYLLSEHGRNIQTLIHEGYKLTTHDVYQIYTQLVNDDADLKNVIGLPAFADIVSGSHSQHFNNVFHAKNSDIASHKLFMQPKNKPGFFQGSLFLENIRPLDHFLLAPFNNTPRENHETEMQWLEACTHQLKERLQNQSLKGLCSSILIRHILGESADNGPDNMLLSDKGVINIDLTGFRYPRQNGFNGSLGWADTLAQNSSHELLERLFHDSVFKNRFVQDSSLPTALKGLVFQVIVDTLKTCVDDLVVDEVAELRTWLAEMNASLVNKSLEKACKKVYANLSQELRFSETHLDTLIAFNQQFITQAVEVAKQCQKNLENRFSMALS